jgi:hypothetical protein
MLSSEFKRRIFEKRVAGTKQYELALRHGLNLGTLSLLLHDGQRVELGGGITAARIVALGAELGLSPAECFAQSTTQEQRTANVDAASPSSHALV